MDFLSLITPLFLVLILCGTMIGIVFGAIPGMTATMAVAVCLPLTYSLGLENGLALLLGLYVGGISGGLVPAILLNIPGTPASIATTFDGYPMTQRGEGETALKIAIYSSLIGGLFSLAVLYLFAPALADFAIRFSYVEKFLIIFLALTVMAALSSSMLIGIFSGVLGILVSLIGAYDVSDGGNGEYRLMFDFMEPYLSSGFSLLPVLIGVFALSSILIEAEAGVPENANAANIALGQGKKFSLSVFRGEWKNLFRSASIGTFVGLLPGVGGSAASIMSYSQAKAFSRNPKSFGKGNPSGIIASETSNNGLTGGALIPLLSLGIPGDSTTAILIGAFTLQGIQVGPLFIGDNLEIWNSMIVAMLVANICMFAVMYFAIRHIAKIVTVPKYILLPIILMMCVVGSYTINYGIMFDVWTLLIFGLFGYLAHHIKLEIAPFVIGFILGPSAEIYFVKSLESFGTVSIFFTKSWIAVVLWILIAISIGLSIWMSRSTARHNDET
ncbi:tripartite tricarboxylate transporter permease [Mesorhizobium sp. RMAD-H1]|uniref:tripartite tricarboxylate transporter permease n=1 Tax=Mesorhizobium sp. RMAD-H1 TaxID=2587065 RepID=UPI00161ADF6D|nr:tripartite tricarboxylate transporter permease [Mesorhizobium sp. RMAD-H1]MBB2971898.1 putative tricarboxylic transport membrane protein [Mesorhizobium sp. RMAD-H1]